MLTLLKPGKRCVPLREVMGPMLLNSSIWPRKQDGQSCTKNQSRGLRHCFMVQAANDACLPHGSHQTSWHLAQAEGCLPELPTPQTGELPVTCLGNAI